MTKTRIVYSSVLVGIILALAACLVAFFVFPLKYSAEARVLVAPHSVPGVDPYTSSKAAERIAQNLAEVVHSSQFFNRVISVPVQIDTKYFPDDELNRRKLWNKTIDASVAYNSGILQVTAYHPDAEQAVRIATAVTTVLTSAGNEYAVNAADFKLVDSPVASRYPTQPNFIVIALAAFLGGFVVSAAYQSARRIG